MFVLLVRFVETFKPKIMIFILLVFLFSCFFIIAYSAINLQIYFSNRGHPEMGLISAVFLSVVLCAGLAQIFYWLLY